MSNWKSVKERLPEKSGPYLCYYHFEGHPHIHFYGVWDFYANDTPRRFQFEQRHSIRVTHWMDLPAPPKLGVKKK
ncbi:MAG: DUF551 domain-containing protein [Clostridia bacterium]|nr:DUF551 domain-containing protein [Clostridia bacterium]